MLSNKFAHANYMRALNRTAGYERDDLRYWLVLEGISNKDAESFYRMSLEQARAFLSGLRAIGHSYTAGKYLAASGAYYEYLGNC